MKIGTGGGGEAGRTKPIPNIEPSSEDRSLAIMTKGICEYTRCDIIGEIKQCTTLHVLNREIERCRSHDVVASNTDLVVRGDPEDGIGEKGGPRGMRK